MPKKKAKNTKQLHCKDLEAPTASTPARAADGVATKTRRKKKKPKTGRKRKREREARACSREAAPSTPTHGTVTQAQEPPASHTPVAPIPNARHTPVAPLPNARSPWTYEEWCAHRARAPPGVWVRTYKEYLDWTVFHQRHSTGPHRSDEEEESESEYNGMLCESCGQNPAEEMFGYGECWNCYMEH